MAGLLDWVDPAREWWKSRPEAVRGLLGGAYSLATDPAAREAAMARQPKPFQDGSGQSMFDQAMNVGPQGLLGKIVYHGSPHKFDKFDASKIGTGEGAQAYGHGVYLADSQGVAKGYADGLSIPEIVSSKGRFNPKSEPITDPKRQAYNVLTQAFQNQSSNPFGLASKYARENIDNPDVLRQVEKHLLDWQDAGAKMESGGALYKADLPDEWIPKMLDYDLPINKQHAAVQDWARQMLKDKKYLRPDDNGPRQLASSWDAYMMEHGGMIKPKGGQGIYEEMAKSFGSPDAASNYLREAGIPGVRYLDGNSRSGGRKTYNYVVFPGLEDQVKILERNGVPLGLFGAMP